MIIHITIYNSNYSYSSFIATYIIYIKYKFNAKFEYIIIAIIK